MLEECGIDKERLRMVNVSAAGAVNLVERIFEMVETVKKLGPNPIKPQVLGFKPQAACCNVEVESDIE
jgi:coenzyme F420-reducing hydrogenase delta subunit